MSDRSLPSGKGRVLSLALQGGGAHGAFTWGVLDWLLEHTGIDFDAVSGVSAGAMNAACLAWGLQDGGRDGARQTLERFWEGVSRLHLGWPAAAEPFPSELLDLGAGPVTMAFTALSWFLSPYQFNPLALNPLGDLLDEVIDFDALKQGSGPELFIGATEVRTGKLRIFRRQEMAREVLLASACLPSLHHAVEIEGRGYWDGGFSGNPPLYPLFTDHESRDLLLVLLTPLQRSRDPVTAVEIRNRMSELSFNTAFMREMRAITDLKRRYRHRFYTLNGFIRRLRALRIHLIEARELMDGLPHESKYDISATFLEELHEAGRRHAQLWWETNHGRIGRTTSVDLEALFL